MNTNSTTKETFFPGETTCAGAFPEPETAAWGPKPRPRGGRPTRLTEAVALEIARWIRLEGASDSAAGLLAGISTSTLSRWKQEEEEFALLLGQARAEFEVGRLRNIGNALNRDGSINWRAQAWLLQHSSPETYGTPSRRRKAAAEREMAEAARATASEGAGEEPANGMYTGGPRVTVSPEQLARLQERRLVALARMQAEEDAKAAAAQRAAVTGPTAKATGSAVGDGVGAANEASEASEASAASAASAPVCGGCTVQNVTIVPETSCEGRVDPVPSRDRAPAERIVAQWPQHLRNQEVRA